MTDLPLAGWIPIRFYGQDGEPRVDWAQTDGRRLTEPFFDASIERCLQSPFRLLFRHQTPADVLLDWQARQPGVEPAGFVFHTSRCGSTLIAQMLAALPRFVVLSEPDPINGVLHPRGFPAPAPDARRREWLRAMVSALGQPWGGAETHLFIKFDSWHTLDLPLIRQAFPEVPWVFVYRDPVEILVSQMRQRGPQMVPGMLDPSIAGIDFLEAVRMPPEEYCARVVGRFCRAALEHYQHGGRLVHYRELPEAVWTSVAGHFGVSFTAAEVEQMRRVALKDAKTPQMPFTADSAAKRRDATDAIRRAAATWVDPLYEQLEAAREASAAS